jgi:hypothetical protein
MNARPTWSAASFARPVLSAASGPAASDSEFLFGGGLVKHPAGSLLAGRMEILVHAPDLEAAREVIAADDSL